MCISSSFPLPLQTSYEPFLIWIFLTLHRTICKAQSTSTLRHCTLIQCLTRLTPFVVSSFIMIKLNPSFPIQHVNKPGMRTWFFLIIQWDSTLNIFKANIYIFMAQQRIIDILSLSIRIAEILSLNIFLFILLPQNILAPSKSTSMYPVFQLGPWL